uniref:Potassium/proton antiporter CemA n=1 Tax=Thujopsis dolabrata TaxID=13727 RepID=A0A1U7EHQ7_THUDO|nr:envelope membrane protein [Thujopsis dolabrata]
MDFIPRSIIRTLLRFWGELTSQSSSLTIHELKVAKYKALASLQYLTCLIVLPWGISISLQNVLESWVTNWWNTGQSKKIFDYLQEDTIRKFEKIEELFLLEIMMEDSSETHSQDIRVEMQKKMIQLVLIYNQDCIQIISHLLANLIGLVVLSVCLILGKKKLGILNSLIQEIFYSLSDTMKALFILFAIDLCLGYHSPHGWKLIMNWIFENYGFAHNERIISFLISTIPVMLDTIFKYWLFYRLNRISPSLVAIYHKINE